MAQVKDEVNNSLNFTMHHIDISRNLKSAERMLKNTTCTLTWIILFQRLGQYILEESM